MFTLFRTLSLGYLRQRWSRSVLLLISVALGVATLVATRALHDALRQSARDVVSPMTGLADLVVVNGQTGVPRTVLDAVRAPAIPGLADIQPIVVARAGLPEQGNTQAWVIGLDLLNQKAQALVESGSRLDAEIEWRTAPGTPAFWGRLALLSLARPPQSPGLVTGPLAARLGGADTIHLRAAGTDATIAVFGTLRLKGDLAVLGENVVFTDLAAAASLATPDRADAITQINLTLEKGADRAAVVDELRRRVGSLGDVQTAEANFEQYLEIAAGLELGFLLGSAGALVVGVFLIYNVLSVGVAERRRDIGILRSVGATRFQIAGLFVAEAFALGLVGSLLGLPLGWAIARLALGPMSQIISELYVAIDPSRLQFTAETLGLALLAGVGTTVIAALVPALQAASEEPADAVRRVPRRLGWVLRGLHVLAVAALLGGGVGFTLLREQLPVRFGAFAGIVCLLLGALVATPLLAEGLGRVLRPLVPRLLGLEGRLAADNLLRTPARTGLVVAALVATTALVVQTAGFIHSSKVAILGWIDRSIAADLFVTSGESVVKLGVTLPMRVDLAEKIAAVPGVAAAVPVHFHRIDYRGRLVLLLVVDLRALQGKGLTHDPARDVERTPELLQPRKVSVSENFARLYGVKPGQAITIPGRNGPVEVEVVGTYADFTWNRGTILVDRAWFEEEYGDRLADVIDVYVAPGHDPKAVRSAIEEAKWSRKEALFATPSGRFKGELAEQIDRVYVFVYAQQVVVGLVALLGVVSALLISVLQRRRELGLLRAVGASQTQILRSVLAEAFLMGLIGAVLGVLVGLALEWYVVDVLVLDEAGFHFPFLVPWGQAGFLAMLALVFPLLVGLWPAWHATRLRIADAIAYE